MSCWILGLVLSLSFYLFTYLAIKFIRTLSARCVLLFSLSFFVSSVICLFVLSKKTTQNKNYQLSTLFVSVCAYFKLSHIVFSFPYQDQATFYVRCCFSLSLSRVVWQGQFAYVFSSPSCIQHQLAKNRFGFSCQCLFHSVFVYHPFKKKRLTK